VAPGGEQSIHAGATLEFAAGAARTGDVAPLLALVEVLVAADDEVDAVAAEVLAAVATVWAAAGAANSIGGAVAIDNSIATVPRNRCATNRR
jgi:hypothetical protein